MYTQPAAWKGIDMAYMDLLLKKISDDEIILSPSIKYRIILFICALIISLSLHVSRASDYPALWGYFLAVLCFLGAFYQEKWTFNKAEKWVVSHIGLIFLYRKKTWIFSDIQEFQLKIVTKGIIHKKRNDFLIFQFLTENGEACTIDYAKKQILIQDKAEQISVFCGKRLIVLT